MAEFKLELDEPLEQRIHDFRKDSVKMRPVNDFVNELIETAKIEAERRKSAMKHKSKYDSLGVQNGTRRIGAWSSRARTSARTFATRVFTAICNCTNSFRNATNAAINRN